MNKFLRSFWYAFNGLVYAFKTQLNFRIHCAAAILVVALGVYIELSLHEWLWVFFAIGLVMIVELLNTGIELLVDWVSPQQHPKAGAIKDLAAAAVLVSAFVAAAIGLCIFVPKFI
ncbi:diacylglycerol kinase family protein [Pedobacter sp. Du54]|uniref:diacylglycerol kinase family protein n=1 Tax=Pedobacter anseongensis TaxID=3133439 RepID=UPI0030B3874D